MLSENGEIELDIYNLAEISTPENFIDELEEVLNKVKHGEKLNNKETAEYYSTDFFYLIGHDHYSEAQISFSKFCPEYKDFKEKTMESEQEIFAANTFDSNQLIKKEQRSEILKGVLMILTGISFTGGGMFMLFLKDFLKGSFTTLFGLAIMVAGYYKLKNK